MKTITVKVTELQEVIKKNRDDHRAIFEKAQKAFRSEMVSVLDKRLNDAKNGRHVDQHIGLLEPEDHTRDYDRVLRMLEMHTSDEIEIEESEFARYVMDDWSWKRQWLVNTASYVDREALVTAGNGSSSSG